MYFYLLLLHDLMSFLQSTSRRLKETFTARIRRTHLAWGLAVPICTDILFFFSLSIWRRRAYDVFFISHIVAFITFPVAVCVFLCGITQIHSPSCLVLAQTWSPYTQCSVLRAGWSGHLCSRCSPSYRQDSHLYHPCLLPVRALHNPSARL